MDSRLVKVLAGDGGDGRVSASSIFRNEFAGPDGGDGGNGAHVLFRADESVTTLEKVTAVVKGENGSPGGTKDKAGKCGQHKVVPVPIGTVIRNVENRQILADLDEDGVMFVAARGGAGGRGNAYFKSSVNQLPKLAESGGKGETFAYQLEVKSMADVGLVGFPNAGKSTFLRCVTRARPKIAPYPFTTLNPHVGVVHFDDYERLVVADIPGIIEDAHKNRGLGIDFLRHIERCSCFFYVIDVTGDDPAGDFDVLKKELEEYEAGLSSRPHAILANKMDLAEADDKLSEFVAKMKKEQVKIFPISAKVGVNIRPVIDFMRLMFDEKRNKNSKK